MHVFLGCAWLACACGPSFQVVYESDVHFEHCYALDESNVASDVKRACWGAWVHDYTFGQPRDRVSYALSRYGALNASTPTDAGTAPGPQSGTPAVAVPVPTNAFAPPPNVAPLTDAGADGAVVGSNAGFNPGAPGAEAVLPNAPGGGRLERERDSGATPADAAPAASASSSRRPHERCTEQCSKAWNACRVGCTDLACTTCDDTYETCVPSCFK